MATKNLFAEMLNQKPITAPQPKAGAVKPRKPPGISEFAYLGQGGSNTIYRHPMENTGQDVSRSLWAHMRNMKPKGVK